MSQVVIDSVAIGGTGGRTVHGAYDDVEQGSTRTYSIGLKVDGDNVAQTEQRWLDAVALCTKRNCRISATMDESAGSFHFDRFPGDGLTLTTQVTLSKDRNKVSTGFTIWGVITVTVDSNLATGTPPAGGGDDSTRPTFQGQVGEWRLVSTYNEGQVEQRSLAITFTTLFDREAAGPLAFSGVVSAGGFARFQFASLAGVTAAAATMLYVSGSTLYDGPHEIAEIDTDLFTVTTRTTWAGDDTGTALFGQQTTPQENYTAQREDLLDLLGVGTNGARSSSTGFALSGETRDEVRTALTIVLTAQWVQADLAEGIRGLTISHEVTNVAEWSAEPEAGEFPVALSASASFHVYGPMQGTNPKALWASIRNTVIAQVKAQAEYGSAEGPIDEVIRADKNAANVVVTMTFRARNLQVLSFKRTSVRRTDLLFQAWQAGIEHYVQTAGIPHDRIISTTVQRIGVGEVELEAQTPDEPGWTYLDITEELGLDGRTKIRGWLGGAEIFAQTLTRVFRRFKLRDGVRVRTPSSGEALPPSSPTTGSPPVITPPSTPPAVPVPPAPPDIIV